MRRADATIACIGALAAALAAAWPARAQVSATLTAATDLRLRGFSLTGGRPGLQAAVAYDGPGGLYAGGSLSGFDPPGAGVRLLGHTEYAGLAWRLRSGPSLDIGAANLDYQLYGAARRRLEYQQVYAGLSRGPLSARLSWSPDFPRHGVDTVYLDLNAAAHPAEGWRLSGHVGVSERRGGSRLLDGRSPRYDLRLGLARSFPGGELELGWTALTPRPEPHSRRNASGFFLSASVYF